MLCIHPPIFPTVIHQHVMFPNPSYHTLPWAPSSAQRHRTSYTTSLLLHTPPPCRQAPTDVTLSFGQRICTKVYRLLTADSARIDILALHTVQ